MVSETWVMPTEQKLFEVAQYARTGAPALKGKHGGRPSGGMMEYTRKNTGWILESEEEGQSGNRIRTVKLGGIKGQNQLRVAVVGVYGPQRKEEEQ